MQDNTVETSTSLSQLLRESYLADSRVHQRHSEMSRSDATSRRLVYGTLTGKSDETGGQDDLPDLSAFLSQEELDKSVNLARQAIGHDPQEERAEEKPPGVHCVVPKIKPLSEKNEEPLSHPLSPDRQTFQAAHKDNLTKNNKSSKEPIQDFRKPPRNNPYGPETQSKKEFLNKAADFIEELSSLFKANSSKRVRPRSCKAHRSRYQTKPDGPVFNLESGDRERANPHFTGPLDVQTDADFEESSLGLQKESSVEEPCETGETENYETKAPAPPQQAEEPLMEPPRFIQKLKSREVPEGSKVQLDCIVRGLPIPDVRWFCEGKELENSPDIQIINNGELHSLIIAEAFEEDTGRYSCFASNFYGTDSTSAEIYIEGASSSDSEADLHVEHVAQSQKKALLSASVLPLVPRIRPVCEEDNISALPHSCLLGEQLPVQEVPTSLSADVVTAPISVQEVPTQLSAQVVAAQLPVQEVPTQLSAQVVAAQLPVQEVSTPSSAPVVTAQLPVQEVSTPLLAPVITTQILAQESQNASVYPQGLDGRPIMAAPVFTKSLQDLVAFEGQLVVLECRVKGVPSPLVDWYREGSMIDDSPDFRILQKKPRSMAESEEICTLVIAEVFPEDSGVFTCTACNKYGTVSSIASLKVKGNEKSSINTKARTILTVESSQHMAPELISPDLTGSSSKPRLYGDLANSSKPQLSILTPDHLSPGVKLGTEGTLLPHNECLSSLLPSDPFHLRCSQEGPRLHHHDPRSSTLPPDSFSSSLMPTLEGTLVNQMEGGLINQNPPQSGAMPLDNSVCLKPNLETPLLNHSQPSYTGSPPDAPSSCLKPKLVNHKEPRSNSRVGLRVHFKLPEDEVESEESSEESLSALEMANNLPHGDMLLSLPNKEPPPILAKPKLVRKSQQKLKMQSQTKGRPSHFLFRDPVQLQLLHNQVLLEQQQDGAPQSLLEPTPWSPTPYHEPKSAPLNTSNSAYIPLPPTAPATSTNMTQSFNYTRPKEFISAQTLSPVRSLSPTESPVPMLHAMAAQVQQKPAVESSFPSFPTAGPQVPQAPRMFPTRVLQSPTSPPAFVSSPTHVSPAFLNSQFVLRPHSPTQASSPTPSSSTPSPIQNPVAFLSSVLPSLPTTPQTNAMGLPKSAPLVSPQGILKKMPKPFRPVTDEDIRDTREIILHDLDKKLRFKEDSARNGQQKLTYEGKTAGRLLGPNNPATVFNYDDVQECPPFQEYKVSNFEQRLMSEIEFRLERTPVEESDDEVQHDEIPTGKCIAPIFDKKLKNFRVMEGVPVTFTCKVVGIPIPKVYWFKDGKQILKKNEHYKKIRERDGTCALHIEAATNDDDGNYTVMAANPQGRNSCSGHLIVQTGPVRGRLTPMIHSQRVRSRVQEVEEGEPIQERFFRPHFLQAPGDMASHEGRLCRLDCKVSGLPNPDLMWLLNGKPILPDFYHRMLVRENGIHSLLIDPLKQSDAGTYTCIATNKAGQNSFSLELSVMEKEVKKAPLLVERLQNTGIAEGAPVRLECRVVGMPPPVIYWKKDNETIPPNKERVSMHQDTTGYVCLLIQPTRKEDAGWYTVSAKNEAGIVSCTARLDIYAQWHQQIPQPMKKVRPTSSRYAALTDQGLDIMSAFPTMDNSPILFASSPVEAALESEEL